MHELSLARDLVDAIERNLGADAARVIRVDISVGAAAGIVSESLRFAFRVLAEGTRAHGAVLEIVTVSARSRCGNCGILFEFDGMIGRCPACGRLGGELLSGDEMILRAIEVTDV
ncbi:MAG: hydrogenase maturation nickel metallochaperone HypA [Candidatus Binataceae bacterium]